ncbi:hypothetical protein ARTHROSP310_05920 [Arthrobacter sp. AD-310]
MAVTGEVRIRPAASCRATVTGGRGLAESKASCRASDQAGAWAPACGVQAAGASTLSSLAIIEAPNVHKSARQQVPGGGRCRRIPVARERCSDEEYLPRFQAIGAPVTGNGDADIYE